MRTALAAMAALEAKMFTHAELEGAAALVHAHFGPTPLLSWPLLCERLGAKIFVKHENHTPTGAFKVRGGLVYVARFKQERRGLGLISATRGNHGQSLAYAGARFDIPVTIYVPHGNSREKNNAMRALGANVIEYGADFQDAREEAERRSQEHSELTFVPSFHRDLVLGVATYSLEIFRATPDLDSLYIAVGQGSGICGAIMARDLLGLKTKIIGVQASGAPSYALSFRARRPIATQSAQTFADGMATRAPDPQALDILLKGAEDIVEIPDDAIAAAMKHYWTDTHNLAEGAGAAPLAAALRDKERNRDKKIGLALSGANIDLDLFLEKISQNFGIAKP